VATRINISVPQDDVAIIDAFTARCKHEGRSRSEAIIELIKTHANIGSMTKWQEAVAEAAKDEPLPDFLL